MYTREAEEAHLLVTVHTLLNSQSTEINLTKFCNEFTIRWKSSMNYLIPKRKLLIKPCTVENEVANEIIF